MAPKRKNSHAGSAFKPKRSRDVLSTSEKVKILDMIEIKKNPMRRLPGCYGKNESSIREVKKNKEKIHVIQADSRIRGFSNRGFSYLRGTSARKKKIGKLRNKRFISFKTRATRERAVTWRNPAAQMRPVLDSSSFFPVPTLPRKLATILLLAFSLFKLVVTLSHCLCSESNKKNMEVSEYPQ
jgi:hypothetical protein